MDSADRGILAAQGDGDFGALSEGLDFNSPRDQIEALSRGKWYPLGLPPRQIDVEEPFFRTRDILELMRELVRRRVEGEPIYLVVANPTVNIAHGLRRQHPELSTDGVSAMADERRRLIGLKDRFFYEAVQRLIAEEAYERGELSAIVPIFMMSDFESIEGFSILHQAVLDLFDFQSHPDFVERVYACVPLNRRSRRHHDKTYGELVTLNNLAILGEMDALCEYVLYQIAMVLFLGGTKLGHEGERPYNEATCLARDLLGAHPFVRPLQFAEVSIPGATGVSPYRARIGMEAAKDPDSFTAYVSFEAYSKFTLQTEISIMGSMRELEDAKRQINIDIIRFKEALEVDPSLSAGLEARIKRHNCDVEKAMLMALLKISSDQEAAVDVQELRVVKFRHILHGLIAQSNLTPVDRERIKNAFLSQDARESILALDQPPKYFESFLLRQTGLVAALNGEISVKELEGRVSTWLPFRCINKPNGWKDYEFLAAAASPLVEPDEPNRVAEWTVALPVFERAIFSDEFFYPPVSTLIDRLNVFFALHCNLYEKVKWEALGHFFDLIAGTPLQCVYQCWLAHLQGQNFSMPSDLETVDEALQVKVSELLNSFAFNEGFRAFFRPFISVS